MREFIVLWAALYAIFWFGFWARGRHDAAKRARDAKSVPWGPEQLPLEFKQWLHDYIVVNAPRRDS